MTHTASGGDGTCWSLLGNLGQASEWLKQGLWDSVSHSLSPSSSVHYPAQHQRDRRALGETCKRSFTTLCWEAFCWWSWSSNFTNHLELRPAAPLSTHASITASVLMSLFNLWLKVGNSDQHGPFALAQQPQSTLFLYHRDFNFTTSCDGKKKKKLSSCNWNILLSIMSSRTYTLQMGETFIYSPLEVYLTCNIFQTIIIGL